MNIVGEIVDGSREWMHYVDVSGCVDGWMDHGSGDQVGATTLNIVSLCPMVIYVTAVTSRMMLSMNKFITNVIPIYF